MRQFCVMIHTEYPIEQQPLLKEETLHSRMQKLAKLTKSCFLQNRHEHAKSYLDIAEQIYQAGDTRTKNLVSNIFVFSISTFLEIHNYCLSDILPQSLFKEYRNQVNASGL